MAKITFIEAGGAEHVIDIEPGRSVMQGAVANNVPGILAECGGAMQCGTCHVHVDPAWVDKLGEPSETEAFLLEDVYEPEPNTRLSCQIEVSDALDGLVVRLPERQI